MMPFAKHTSLLLLFVFSNLVYSQQLTSIQQYKEKGDAAYESNLYKKAFEYYSEYLQQNNKDSIILEKASMAGLYCLKNNIAYEKNADYIPRYFYTLTHDLGREDLYENMAEANYYAGIYYKNAIPHKAADFFLQCLMTLDGIDSKNTSGEQNRDKLKIKALKEYDETIAYRIRVDAYNSLIHDISTILKTDKLLAEPENTKLLSKQRVLDSYVETNNFLMYQGEHHFINKTVDDIQEILLTLKDNEIDEYISPLSRFILHNFETNSASHQFKIEQAKGIKLIAEEHKNPTPSEAEKRQYWEAYSQRQANAKKQKLAALYGNETIDSLYSQGISIGLSSQICQTFSGKPLLVETHSFLWGKIEILIYSNEKYYIFRNNKLIQFAL